MRRDWLHALTLTRTYRDDRNSAQQLCRVETHNRFVRCVPRPTPGFPRLLTGCTRTVWPAACFLQLHADARAPRCRRQRHVTGAVPIRDASRAGPGAHARAGRAPVQYPAECVRTAGQRPRPRGTHPDATRRTIRFKITIGVDRPLVPSAHHAMAR